MSWRPGVILRHRESGRPLKVLHSYKGATMVVELENPANPTPTLVLLERDYDHWVDEKKLVVKEKREGWTGASTINWKVVVI